MNLAKQIEGNLEGHDEDTKVLDGGKKSVSITLDISSVPMLDSDIRVRAMQTVLKDRPVKVSASNQYGAVTLEFDL